MDLGRLKKLLLISILVNVLLLGILLGYGFGQLWQEKLRLMPRFPEKLLSTLPEAKQEKITKELKQLRKSSRQDFKQLRRTRRETREILTAPQFDPATYEAKMKELHEIHGRLQSNKTEMVKDLATSLSQEERQALAQLLKKSPRGRRKGRPHRGPPHGRDHRGPPPPQNFQD